MPRYVAFLRGVSPVNASMPALKRCFEAAGFENVRTILASGNVAFDARAASVSTLARRAEAAMQAGLGRSFRTIVRSVAFLDRLIASEPFAAFRLPRAAKRVVTFLGKPSRTRLKLPLRRDGARILVMRGSEVFTAYEPNPRGPVFMALIERTFGTEITTRTWDTVRKCARA